MPKPPQSQVSRKRSSILSYLSSASEKILGVHHLVCDPNANYGFNKLGGSIQDGVGLALQARGQMSEQACCVACFPEGSLCFVYEYFNNVCYIAIETSGSHTPTDYCPYGVYEISSPDGGSFYEIGSCTVFA
jgi:hypothetical protein